MGDVVIGQPDTTHDRDKDETLSAEDQAAVDAAQVIFTPDHSLDFDDDATVDDVAADDDDDDATENLSAPEEDDDE